MQKLYTLIDRLSRGEMLTKEEFVSLIENHRDKALSEYLFEKARAVREEHYGKDVYLRGLIEISNYCKNDCLYCGIRKSNKCASRYRLTDEDILSCCEKGHALGYRTFVLQSGEDENDTDERITSLVSQIRKKYPDCAITLSIGEKSRESYQKYYDAGANRYLLRHETATKAHYDRLHPHNLSHENRIRCLYDLKDIGFQTGCGFMVGSPYQTTEHLAEDLLFLHKLQPDMVGIGPFIAHKDTPFKNEPSGTLELTLFMLGLTRLLLPSVLLPATTALGSIAENGREQGILAGANVVMPNLSPENVREKYMLYDGKLHTGAEAAECLEALKESMEKIGYRVAMVRGDRKQ